MFRPICPAHVANLGTSPARRTSHGSAGSATKARPACVFACGRPVPEYIAPAATGPVPRACGEMAEWSKAHPNGKPFGLPKGGCVRLQIGRQLLRRTHSGEMAEWSKAHAWKVCRRVTVSRVRIPLSPPVPLVRIGLLQGERALSALDSRRKRPHPAKRAAHCGRRVGCISGGVPRTVSTRVTGSDANRWKIVCPSLRVLTRPRVRSFERCCDNGD